jgi:putrescine transport system ATP-binding protein
MNKPSPHVNSADSVAFLRIHQVVKVFGDHTAVNGVTLDITQGEIFALLGPSGCGKTTLLRMLAGLEQPTSGSIALQGHNLALMAPHARPMNMMFQSYALFPHMNVWDNVAFGPRRSGLRGQALQTRVDEMLKLVQLNELAQRKPHQLSGGQQQRVALARSLARKPQLLLLDEPLGALDKKLREETQIELVRIIQEVGVTCVMVTHDQEEAMKMATRIAVMNEGRILQVGVPSVLYETPAHRFVADFIGSVNLMDGTVVADQADHVHIACADCVHHVGHGITGVKGMQVSVALRPEKIRIARSAPVLGQGAPTTEFNCVKGILQHTAYFGSFTTYHLLLPSGLVLKVSSSNTERHNEQALRNGEAAWASWLPTAQVVLTT